MLAVQYSDRYIGFRRLPPAKSDRSFSYRLESSNAIQAAAVAAIKSSEPLLRARNPVDDRQTEAGSSRVGTRSPRGA